MGLRHLRALLLSDLGRDVRSLGASLSLLEEGWALGACEAATGPRPLALLMVSRCHVAVEAAKTTGGPCPSRPCPRRAVFSGPPEPTAVANAGSVHARGACQTCHRASQMWGTCPVHGGQGRCRVGGPGLGPHSRIKAFTKFFSSFFKGFIYF